MKVKKLKKKSVYKMFALMLTATVTSTTFGFDSIVRAATDKEEDFIKTSVTYNDEKTQANVKFEIDSIDQKYEVTSIILDKEGTVIYDNTKVAEENKPVAYKTTENGSYKFTVKYVEKKKEEAVENVAENKAKSKEISETEKSSYESMIVDNRNETTIRDESSVVQEKNLNQVEIKESTVNVTVDRIKEKNSEVVLENSSNEENKQEKAGDFVDSAAEVKSTNEKSETTFNIQRANKNESVNLKDSFNFSGVKMNYDGDKKENIDSSYYKIEPSNKIVLGKDDREYVRQSIALTSKYKVDFKRCFEIAGTANISSMPDGFAIGFHTNPNYVNKNTGGSLGVYSLPGYPNTSEKGIPNGIVLEVDTFNNMSGNGTSPFGDDQNQQSGTNGTHIAINKTDNSGVVIENVNDYGIEKILDKNVAFKISWIPSENKIKFQIGKKSLEYNVGDYGEYLKGTDVYYTVASVLSLIDKSGDDILEERYDTKSTITLDTFKYTDIQPQITTTVNTVKQGYAIPTEKVTVTHEIKNEKSTIELYDELNLENMKMDNAGNNLAISNVKVGERLDQLSSYTDKNGVFDKNTPISVKYPANSGSYYVQYEVEIPDLKNYGSTNHLDYEVLLGLKGMTQFSSNGSLEIRNNPSLVTKRDGQPKDTLDVFNVSRVEDVTIDALWQEIYAKKATGAETKLSTEDNNANDFNIEWKYFENLIDVNGLPSNVEKGKIYSLYIKVSDKDDPRLTNVFSRYIVVADHIYTDGEYYIYGSDSTSISETKLVTLSEQDFKEYVKANANPGAFKHVKDGNMQMKDVDVNTTGWLDSNYIPYKLPGEQQINLFVSEKPGVKLQVKQEVTENTWSYDTKDRTEANGASGFIVIPKGINMNVGSGKDKDKLVADGNLFFANYDAKDVRYKLYVDKSFELTKTDDASNKINVTSYFPGSEDKGNNRLFIDTMNFRYHKDNPLTINFKATRSKENKTKGRWNGNVTFYFERVN